MLALLLLASGLDAPTSAAVGPNGTVFVAVKGGVVRIADGKPTPFATGLSTPTHLAAFRDQLFALDAGRVVRIDPKGKVSEVVPADALKQPAAMCLDAESGRLLIGSAAGGVVTITKGKPTEVLTGGPPLAGLTSDGANHLLLVNANGECVRLALATKKLEPVGVLAAGPLAWDGFGRLFAGGPKGMAIVRPGAKPVPVTLPGKIAGRHPDGRLLLIDGDKLVAHTPVIPGHEIDDTPLSVKLEPAFDNVTWTGWDRETADGKPNPLRPIALTHANDGRTFLATQHGQIHIIPKNGTGPTKVFLDIRDRVKYDDKTNEEGLLGLAFHPKYQQTGELFVFYTPKREKMVNVVSRFRVSKDDPDRAEPATEEQIVRYERRPFWNHDGGTVCFGPDGMLYVTHGHGGAANDPHENGQNLSTLFGKVLRIDVDAKENGKPYAVPKDNPFVGRTDARPEIWAYGLRNVWRMSFDRGTGRLWAADVGQNLYEEINLVTRGGNYGWNRREALHPFGAKGVAGNTAVTDPIWEYHHDIGKSITGGHVYRGKAVPALVGHYLYGDYVSSKVWALKYDDAAGRVVANRPVPDRGVPILSFGEDEAGEAYLLTTTPTGKGGVLRFVAK